MSNDDSIEIRVRFPAPPARVRVTIGDTTYEFPEGTTREQAQSVLDDAKALYLRSLGLTPFAPLKKR